MKSPDCASVLARASASACDNAADLDTVAAAAYSSCASSQMLPVQTRRAVGCAANFCAAQPEKLGSTSCRAADH